MKDVMGIINLNENEMYMEKLTLHRPLAAMPFAGRYRLIDFALSNMVNAGIRNVGILVQDKYRALMDHLRSGKEWDLDRKWEGLYILPPFQNSLAMQSVKGEMGNFYSNLDYIRNSRQKYVLVTGTAMVCNIDFNRVLAFHQQQDADITLVYKEWESPEEDCRLCNVIKTDGTGRVTDMQINPATSRQTKSCLEMYLMQRDLLIELIESCASRGEHSMVQDGIMRNIGRLKIYGYAFQGYLARIHSTQDYYRHSMNLLAPEVWRDLFLRSGIIYTKVKDGAPTQYKESSRVVNSLVASSCIIEGQVENSILFRGVKVHRGAYIKDCIIMQKSEICENAVVENVICDKDVHITGGKNLKGEKSYPFVIAKGTVI
ncbi:nucleotide-diphospho-sugar transferases [Lucifera butyrica]|uniref:Nucleotide-diphospho-sugar transferases n=1 Tax=Lucifera butyrica TaxID=1351585 RepID=A0A498R431_9FIRM|nr:glucose-1-phosphate adenylyltransferase subunit GlgD [Lucifera butyrica]VBB05022.1 nucleotide-diphospho-sugar transferases [Lucifera butyrica]